MSDQIVRLVFSVLKAYRVFITRQTMEQTILTHPDYPSMLCVSDALHSWKVKHIVIQVTLEKLRLLDVPVMAHLKKGELVWVTRITDKDVHYWNASGKSAVEGCTEFEKKWSGAALAITDASEAGETNYRKKRRQEVKEQIFRYALVGGCVVLFSVLMYFSWANDACLSLLPKLTLLLVNAAGCCISYTLIRQEKHQANKLANMFCKAGAHIDCDQVTKSHYSKLLRLLSWAELGMAYFTTIILWLAIAPVSAVWLSPVIWLLLVPLPFTAWSLFTQAFLIRKWCLFCCAIVVLLWINAGIVYLFLPIHSNLPVVETSLLALLLLLCTGAIMYVGKISKTRDNYSQQRETARIKYDYKTLQGQLAENRHEIGNLGFVFGNSQSTHEISLYVSIACSHCGAAVKELRRLTEIFPELCFRLIFSVHTDNLDHKVNIITSYLIGLYKTMSQKEFFDLLDAWYSTLNKQLDALQKAYPVTTDQDNKEEILALYRFSQQVKIGYTPAILLNGRLLSQLYSYKDLYGIARVLNTE